MYGCVYACMYICMYACVCVCTRVCDACNACIALHVRMLFVYVCDVCMRAVRACLYVCVSVIHVCMYVCMQCNVMQLCMHVMHVMRKSQCMYVCNVCMCAFM